VAAYVGCIAGAIPIAAYEQLLRDAGFDAVQVVDAKKDLNAYAKVENQSGCCGSGCSASELHTALADLVGRYDANAYAASVRVLAVKPATTKRTSSQLKETTMTTLQVFDKPMCCSTGICGPKVDPVLPTFASDLAWLKDQGVAVERYNLAHQPQAFVNHADVREAIRENHEHALPLVRVNGQIVSKGVYPSRQVLASWCGVPPLTPLPVTEHTCSSTGCC